MKYFFIFIISFNFAFSQYSIRTIDTVYSFSPGEGQNFGQSPEFFPNNIFGFPDSNATENVPSARESEILSLGFGGEITVGVKNARIINGEGVDFTIFENVFLNPVTKKYFVEPAKVSVSQDGINFIDFPFDSTTFQGCAGTLPTNGKANPFIPETCGGNGFDLSELNLDYITQIRITDISKMIFDNPSHPYYDPIISGFDLDAVVVWHSETTGSDISKFEYSDEKFNSIRIFTDYIEIFNTKSDCKKAEIYNILGNKVLSEIIDSNAINVNVVDISRLQAGVYFLKVNNKVFKFLKK